MTFKYHMDIETEMFLGILEEEKQRKNRVRIHIEYKSDDKPDYSEIYKTVMHITESEQFGYMENCAKYMYDELHENHSITDLTVTIEKISPLAMDQCKQIKVIYGP